MIEIYANLIQLAEEASRIALKSLDIQIQNNNINDISIKECLLLYNIGNEGEVSYKHMRQFLFMGTNPSYIVSKMKDNGYIYQKHHNHDSRQLTLCLTEKGKELYKKISNFIEKDLKFLNENDISSEFLKNYHTFSKKFKNILCNKISNEMIFV